MTRTTKATKALTEGAENLGRARAAHSALKPGSTFDGKAGAVIELRDPSDWAPMPFNTHAAAAGGFGSEALSSTNR